MAEVPAFKNDLLSIIRTNGEANISGLSNILIVSRVRLSDKPSFGESNMLVLNFATILADGVSLFLSFSTNCKLVLGSKKSLFQNFRRVRKKSWNKKFQRPSEFDRKVRAVL